MKDIRYRIAGAAQLATILSNDKKPEEEKQPDLLDKFLKFLKYKPEEIKGVREGIDSVAAFAGTIGSAVAAFNTVKGLLEFAGILEKHDPNGLLLASIQGGVNKLISRVGNDSRRAIFEKRTPWTDAIRKVQSALADLKISRSPEHFKAANDAIADLMSALHGMLDHAPDPEFDSSAMPVAGRVPFLRVNYGYLWNNNAPDHWIDYAYHPFMATYDPKKATKIGMPIYLNNESDDLAKDIWDAGYYLDLLIRSVGLFIAALTVIEPAFRSTGHRREDLRYLSAGLKAFLDHWDQSLLVTRVDGCIDPWASHSLPGQVLLHEIHHPWAFWAPHIYGRRIALAVVDPVTGLSLFNPSYDGGFDIFDFFPSGLDPMPHYFITNYDTATNTTRGELEKMVARIRDACGLTALRAVHNELVELGTSPFGSIFCEISDTKNNNIFLWHSPVDEKINLGVGSVAGTAGKLYTAKRIFQTSNKTFRVPMVRRMDASRMQLGYRMVVSLPGAAEKIDLELCDASTASSPDQSLDQSLPIFPNTTFVQELRSQTAEVYDVVQSAVFTPEDEDLLENGDFVFEKQRLFLNQRNGSVAIRVTVDFSIDLQNPDHQYIGFANVKLENLTVEAPEGFIVSVNVFETGISSVTSGELELFADAATLHFVPSFLVPEPDYWKDRLAALVVLDKAKTEVEQDIELIPKPWDKMWRYREFAVNERNTVQAIERFARRRPDVAEEILSRFRPPTIHRERP